MTYFGMVALSVEPNWLFDKIYLRDSFQASKLANVETYCFVKYAPENFDSNNFRQFSVETFNYAKKYRSGLPLGLVGSLVVYSCLIVERVTTEHISFINKYVNKHFAAFEFPSILDISTGNIYCYPKTPMWGALYYRGFKKETGEIFSPVFWKQITNL